MCKRLWKNAILALCVLALVLQPVIIYGAVSSFEPLNFINTSNFNDFDNVKLGYDDFPILYGLTFQGSISNTNIQNLITHFNLDTSNYYFVQNNTAFQSFYAIPFEIGPVSGSSNPYSFKNFSFENQTYYTYASLTGYTTNTVNAFGGFTIAYNNGTNVACFDATKSFTFYYCTTTTGLEADKPTYAIGLNDAYVEPTPPDIPSIDPSNPSGTTGADYALNIYYQLAFLLSENFNCWTPNGSVHFNETWFGVGQFLTYDMLCKLNPSSPTVSVTLSDGTTQNYSNYIYQQNNNIKDYSTVLASLDSKMSTNNSTLSTISSRVNTTNTRLNTINTSINNQMNEVNDKLDAAFPSNQAAINDFIAEDLMDDTGGNGLTINRIASSKSDLDDGLDTFKLDISQSQYSNPFSALDDADWSFWSQTTLNNLGSGYSYSFSEGSLMSENDVFTENQNVLLNLLGW